MNNWHIGLMNLGGGTYHETLLVPNNIATSAGEVGADCAGMGFAVDQFIANAFTVSGGVFTYNAAAVAGAGATLIGGSSTPAITGVMTANAGIRLTGTTSGTTISNVTSTNNGSGISFGATLNGGNTVSESVFNNNLDQDVFSASNATNTFDNVDFTRTSSTITGTAPIMVRYETRLLAERNGSLVAVSGASASSTDGYSFVTSLGTTSGSGFTSYADLPAYEITSGSNALTNGGYNPYSFNVAAVNYFASSTSQLLSHRNQTITLVMNSSVPPTAPSGATVISMGSTTSTIGWTDNSDNETSFLLNYIDLSAGQTFRGGVISSLAANTTSTLISGLVPDDYYRFRVAATGTIGLSTYATSSPFLTNLAVPNVPAVTALSETSESVTLDTNGNSTSTVYALYGSTLGSYLDTTGAVSSTEVWATSSTWGTITVSGLTCGTSYSFSVIARGQTGILSATSTPASVSTSGCSSLGGGGGGGSGGGGFYSVTTNSDGTVRSTYLGPIVNPAPIVGTSSSTSPSVTVVSSEVKSPPKHGSSHADLLEALSLKRDLAAETRGHRGVLEDAKAFHVKLTPGQIDDLSFFLAYGFSQTTAYLGERERRSILRDIFDVFGSGAITTQDIENLVTGRVPTQIRLTPARLRIRTRQIAPVFQRIYKHKPNLKNPHDALAWDVLLYHIRFSREIKKDAKGLADYRKLFKRAPVSPLDWAAVRAMGYVG